MSAPSSWDRPAAVVGVIMGSDSDLPVLQGAVDVLDRFGVPNEVRVVSAHRAPHQMLRYAATARERGLRVIIAGAGGAAHLPGMVAAATTLPVIGVPVGLARLDGLDSLLSIVSMPSGVPVATVGVDNATNAGLLAVRLLAIADASLAEALDAHAAELERLVQGKDARVASARAPTPS